MSTAPNIVDRVVDAPASAPSKCSAPNGYDRAFVEWFREHGWCVHARLGDLEVWTFNDAHCRFKVTAGMVLRLLEAKWLVQFFPDRGDVFDGWYQTPEYMPDSYKQNIPILPHEGR